MLFFSLGTPYWHFLPRKNLISYTKKILTVATCRDIVKPKRYYPVFVTCIELAIGVLQWLKTGACREQLSFCMLHFLLHALSQLCPALKVLSPLYWPFKLSFVPKAFQSKKPSSELNPGLTLIQLASWGKVEGCSTWRVRRKKVEVCIAVL